ncbi:sulfotransferase family protein [Prochlorococcus marinus]|uniref:sulfotransferase family protein n=1 Tax=Prochlorococcus marinus TaxID=1219 RepID=UPI0007B3793D|nr:sulfotransferase [Prochlorococcus marinus]
MKRPPLVLVVGMHRSGTSLIGSILQHLGLILPGETIAGDPNNPEGYFERHDVTQLQEQLLIDLDRFWAGPRGAEPLPSLWRSDPATLRCEQGLRLILQEEALRQKRPWAIKDPRSSVLLPLWRQLCKELNIPLRLVLAVRDPEAVVASVMARDERLAGMTWWRAQQLWWRFNTAVLTTSPLADEAEPLVLHYEAWFTNPEGQARLLAADLGLPEPKADQLNAIKAAIKPEHRHQIPLPDVAPPLDPRLKQLHQWLDQRKTVRLPRKLFKGPLKPLRPLRQQLAHSLDWLWLVGSPLLEKGGLWSYRKSFLQAFGCGPLVSPVWITRQRPSLLREHRDPLAWYQRVGWRLGVNPHPLLESARIWAQLGLRKEAVALYRREAIHDDIQVHPRFDSVHYRQQCRQADCTAKPTPLEHYLVEGWQQGLAPHPAVHPLWMKRRHGLPGEPLVALILDGGDPTDPGLTHPCGNLYGAALAEPVCSTRLPVALVDLLRLWNKRGLWPAERWLAPNAMQKLLPSFNLFDTEQASLFALGLQVPLTAASRLQFPQTLAFGLELPWRAERLLAGCSDQLAITKSASVRLHVLEDADDCLRWQRTSSPEDWLINLYWPPPNSLASWIQGLRGMEAVLDPDPQRTAFLQLFGVKAFHQPFQPLELAPCSDEDLLRLAQLKLGLPDPRWFEPPIELVVIGSSGPIQERRWGELGLKLEAAGLLLLPRLPQIEIANLDQLKALQAWLNQLAQSCKRVLWLEPIQQGACQFSSEAVVLAPEVEPELLLEWESRRR